MRHHAKQGSTVKHWRQRALRHYAPTAYEWEPRRGVWLDGPRPVRRAGVVTRLPFGVRADA